MGKDRTEMGKDGKCDDVIIREDQSYLYAKPTAPPVYSEEEIPVGTPISHVVQPKHSRVQALVEHFDLEYEMAVDLLDTAGTEVVVIADDSGSMRSRSHMPGVPQVQTRWQELQYTLRRLLEVLLAVDDDGGFELCFLNSNSGMPVSIRNEADLEQCWAFASPGGATPLVSRLQQYCSQATAKQGRILMVMTDGCPSDGSFATLRQAVGAKGETVYVNFMMCTDDDDIVNKYEGAIDAIPGVDVHDDYQSEQEQARKCGNKLGYTRYLAKCVLGAKFLKYDCLDDHGTSKIGNNHTIHIKQNQVQTAGQHRSTVPNAKGGTCACSIM